MLIYGGKVTEWIPTHTDALVAMLPYLSFPLDCLHLLTVNATIELGAAINSQSQLELIQQHAADANLTAKVRTYCSKWATQVLACQQGLTRWRQTDNIVKWSQLEKLNEDLLTGTTNTQLGTSRLGDSQHSTCRYSFLVHLCS